MSVSITAAPSRTNSSASATPCPPAAPVISATLPASFGMIPSSQIVGRVEQSVTRHAARAEPMAGSAPLHPPYGTPPCGPGGPSDSRFRQPRLVALARVFLPVLAEAVLRGFD